MAVVINDVCIACDACLQQCPVNAIVDDSNNPDQNNIYYVKADKCVECEKLYDEPQCASICPVEGCITWGAVSHKLHRSDISDDSRNNGTPVLHWLAS